MSNDDIIRTVENDIEFFTLKETGESGISITGLSLLCGISKSALSQLFSNLLSKTAPKRLKPSIYKDYNLLSKYRKQGGFVKILRADFCADIIIHYAFLGNEIAQESLMKFTQAGINVWIQNITGWQPVNAIPTVEPTIAQIEAVFAGLYALPLKKELIESAKLSAHWLRQIPDTVGESNLSVFQNEVQKEFARKRWKWFNQVIHGSRRC